MGETGRVLKGEKIVFREMEYEEPRGLCNWCKKPYGDDIAREGFVIRHLPFVPEDPEKLPDRLEMELTSLQEKGSLVINVDYSRSGDPVGVVLCCCKECARAAREAYNGEIVYRKALQTLGGSTLEDIPIKGNA